MNERRIEKGEGKGVEQSRKDKMRSDINVKGPWTLKLKCNEKDDRTKSCEFVTHSRGNLHPSLYKLYKQTKMLLLFSRVS